MQLYMLYKYVFRTESSVRGPLNHFNPALAAALRDLLHTVRPENWDEIELTIILESPDSPERNAKIKQDIVNLYDQGLAENHKNTNVATQVKKLLTAANIEPSRSSIFKEDMSDVYLFGLTGSGLSNEVQAINGNVIYYTQNLGLKPDPELDKQILGHAGPIELLLDIDDTLFFRYLTWRQNVCIVNPGLIDLVAKVYGQKNHQLSEKNHQLSDVNTQFITGRPSPATKAELYQAEQNAVYGVPNMQSVAQSLDAALTELESLESNDATEIIKAALESAKQENIKALTRAIRYANRGTADQIHQFETNLFSENVILSTFARSVENIADTNISNDPTQVWYVETDTNRHTEGEKKGEKKTKAEFIKEHNLLPNRSEEEQSVLLVVVDDQLPELLSYEEHREYFASLGYTLIIRQSVATSSFFGPSNQLNPWEQLNEDHIGLDEGHIGPDEDHIGLDEGHIGPDEDHIGLDEGHIGLDEGHIGPAWPSFGIWSEATTSEDPTTVENDWGVGPSTQSAT